MLPDRLTISTCLGCGAMGRAASCEGECSEHRLALVDAGDHDALRAAIAAARASVEIFGRVARRLADVPPTEERCAQAYAELRATARAALHQAPPADERDWSHPDVRIGWWCAECGNVDAPQPCIGVCIWRPAEFVNADVHAAVLERGAEDLRSARDLRRLLAQISAVAPRDGACRATWRAFAGRAAAPALPERR